MSEKFHLPKGEGTEYDDYTVSFDSSSGALTVDCPAKEKINIVIKGIENVRKVENATSWNYNRNNRELTILAEGKNIRVGVAQ